MIHKIKLFNSDKIYINVISQSLWSTYGMGQPDWNELYFEINYARISDLAMFIHSNDFINSSVGLYLIQPRLYEIGKDPFSKQIGAPPTSKKWVFIFVAHSAPRCSERSSLYISRMFVPWSRTLPLPMSIC